MSREPRASEEVEPRLVESIFESESRLDTRKKVQLAIKMVSRTREIKVKVGSRTREPDRKSKWLERDFAVLHANRNAPNLQRTKNAFFPLEDLALGEDNAVEIGACVTRSHLHSSAF